MSKAWKNGSKCAWQSKVWKLVFLKKTNFDFVLFFILNAARPRQCMHGCMSDMRKCKKLLIHLLESRTKVKENICFWISSHLADNFQWGINEGLGYLNQCREKIRSGKKDFFHFNDKCHLVNGKIKDNWLLKSTVCTTGY